MRLDKLNKRPLFLEQVRNLAWTEWEADWVLCGFTKDTFLDIDSFYVFSEGDVVVGFVSLSQDDLGISKPSGRFLSNLFIKEEYRGKGCGAYIVSEMKKLGEQGGDKWMFLWTYGTLWRYYERIANFQIDTVLSRGYLTHSPVYIMRLELEPIQNPPNI